MDLYGRQQYEDLDFVTQATEPIQDSIIGLYNSIPNSIELSFDKIKSLFKEDSGTWRLHISMPIRRIIEAYIPESTDYETKKDLYSLFQISISDGAEIDLVNEELIGTIVVAKKHEYVPESFLKQRLARAGDEWNTYSVSSDPDCGRINEVLDLLGQKPQALSSRSMRVKYEAVRMRFQEIFQNDEWKIRDEQLARKVCRWAKDYVYYGNMAAMTNFCALKVMTHGGLPIYKLNEVQ